MLGFLKRIFSSKPTIQWSAWSEEEEMKRFTDCQNQCISNGKWIYGGIQQELRGGKEISERKLRRCFWSIVFAHFRDLNDVYAGYTLDLTIVDIIERNRTAMDVVLLPKLKEIIVCQDRLEKARLAEQYAFILMAAVFDCSGGTIHSCAIRAILDADKVDSMEADKININRQAYLEPLGFKPHHYQEDGENLTTWYWPKAS